MASMDVRPRTDNEQAKLWNGAGGLAWVETQELLDQIYKPFEEMLVAPIAESTRGTVLDVGCGTGSTTVALARRLGANGAAVGIDISETMLAAARARAERESVAARFIRANAEVH